MKKPFFKLLICFALIAVLVFVGIRFGTKLREDDPEAIGEELTEILRAGQGTVPCLVLERQEVSTQ